MKAPAFYDALPIGTRAAILMTISAVTYALTFVTVRALSETFSVYQLVLLRAAIGTAFMLPWLCRSGPTRAVKVLTSQGHNRHPGH